MGDFHDVLERVINDTVAPNAGAIDKEGRFPRESIDALAKAGILALTVPSEFGGGGGDLEDAASVIRELSTACGSTAMVVLMHFAAAAVINNHGPDNIKRAIAEGRHLTTLAFSEVGSRSHFWVPQGTATLTNAGIQLDANKSWVTSANEANSYVWSSRPVDADGPMSLWFVPADTPGISAKGAFDGLGLRGNDSTPVDARAAVVPKDALLGVDGGGLDLALSEVLPWFLTMSAAFSVGLMDAVTEETGRHLSSARLEHLEQTLAEQPLQRADHARMRVTTDQAAAILDDTIRALSIGRDDAMLRVLEVKIAAGEAATVVTNLAMKICGGSAFRKELGIERRFRDSLAARVMAPTTDALLDFVGRVINGLPLL